jgi:acyl phosphate:glycerol-3-phosphate acyltransferase
MNHPGRKVYHLVGGLGLLTLYYFLGRDRALLVYATLFVVVLALDLMRLRIPAVNSFIFTKFRSVIRTNEENKLTGTAPYILGVGATLYLYRTDLATLAICFLAFGDVAATMIGERYGKTKIGNKSLEGSIAFVVAAVTSGFLLSLAGISVMSGLVLAGALIAAGVELLPLPVNDNFLIPVVSGGAMSLIARMPGCS